MKDFSERQLISLIDAAITDGTETNRVEFKDCRSGSLPTDLWRPISAFSHQPVGGWIVFGVVEDRINKKTHAVGGLDLAGLQEQVINYVLDSMENCATPDFRIITCKKKRLLVYHVASIPDERKPCFYKKMGLPNGACLRVGTSNRIITVEEMRLFIRNSEVFKFDRNQALGADTTMLSIRKIGDLLIKSASKSGRTSASNAVTPKLMKNLGIIASYGNQVSPTVAGFLIFSKTNPQQLSAFSRYIIRCVRYQGDSVSSSIIDKQDIDGTIDQQIEGIQKFILRNVALKASIAGAKRIERYEYPEDALRELVANAVIHRDYQITETYTQVAIFSNRIEISNPGNLPPGITLENIKDSQFSRNEVIAALLRDLDYLEEYGRGIDIVYSRMKEWNLPAPIFRNTSNSFRVTLLGEPFASLNDRQQSIWQNIQERKHLTARQCLEDFPEVSRQTINNDLKKLVDTGLILAKGTASNTYYESQY